MPTALQMVNRVRRKLGEVDAVDFVTQENQQVLDAVNGAIGDVLEGRSFSFDRRMDGIFTTVAEQTITTTSPNSVTVTNGSTTVTISDGAGGTPVTTPTGSFVRRLRISTDGTFGDEEFRVVSHNGVDAFVIDTPYPGTTSAAATAVTFAYEYVLPVTVRKVESVTHQSGDFQLVHVDGPFDLDAVRPRPSAATSTNPKKVYVGGTAESTYDSTGGVTSGTLGMRLGLEEVPSAVVVIHYAYVRRHANLVAVDDNLTGVPDIWVDKIATKATAMLQYTNLGNNPVMGEALNRAVEFSIDQRHKAQQPSPTRVQSLRPLFPRKSARTEVGVRPRRIPIP